jgi:hypothetical protein
MTISLAQPSINSTGWGPSVNNNFSLIQGAINRGCCQFFLTTGTSTFTTPPGVTQLMVLFYGGGGGPCDYLNHGDGPPINGYPPGYGGSVWTSISSPLATYTVTIGAAGVSGGDTGTGDPGGPGGTSSFGSAATCTGGGGGSQTAAGANGTGSQTGIGLNYAPFWVPGYGTAGNPGFGFVLY